VKGLFLTSGKLFANSVSREEKGSFGVGFSWSCTPCVRPPGENRGKNTRCFRVANVREKEGVRPG